MHERGGAASLRVPNWQYFQNLLNRLHLTGDDTRSGPSLPVALRLHGRGQYSLYTDVRAPTGQPYDAEGLAKLHLSFRFGRICLLVNSLQVRRMEDIAYSVRPGLVRGMYNAGQPAQLCVPNGSIGAYSAMLSLTEHCALYATNQAGLAYGEPLGTELDGRNFIEGGLGRIALGLANDHAAPVQPIKPGI